MIIPEKKIAFVHIRKTGGTSIEAYFGLGPGTLGVEPYYGQKPDHRHLFGGALTHLDIASIRKKQDLTGYRVFTVVRNPYSRIVSQAAWLRDKWHKKECIEVSDFRDYAPVANLRCQNQAIDKSVQVFKLEDGLTQVMQWLGEDGDLEHRMASAHQPWQSYYDEKRAEFIYRRYQRDFDEFGYDRNSWRDMDGHKQQAACEAGRILSSVG